MPRLVPVLALILTPWALTSPAAADMLRCGSSLIEVGDSMETVLQKCGEPASRQTVSEPVWILGADGNRYQSGTQQWELWRYDRGPRQFPAILKIADGVVESIDFVKSPGG